MNSMTCARKNKRRISNEQVKSLEIMFQSDSRPESKTKRAIAGELGLQPCQVAIWFQNRRARSRTKQIEREYSILKTSYNNLFSRVESLKKENLELNIQLREVKTLLGMHHESENSGFVKTEEAEGGKKAIKSNGVTSHLLEGCKDKVGKDAEVVELAQSRDGSLTSSVNWSSFESCCYVNETSCSQWWEFLS
ncbi:Homeobox-leucine zipper protein ATHB-7 [Morus notabilis]|uniref:Homeobox-leucine zipper protein n=1 Tax=Morus notabilis TaxID=981085 RepID=W9S105_9ROSA|nr:homeobox-leucine zipper protein ATHB-12 [Morus notabilis]EXB81870.1 Homeobox-leucine zipper protein ATHB-7 [Morus notabilis]